MQNTIGTADASATLADIGAEKRARGGNLISAESKFNRSTGHGARALEELAQRYGHARARRFLALSGAEIDGDALSELYHVEFAKAATFTGCLVPDFESEAWRVALEDATRATDAFHYAHKRDKQRLRSRDARTAGSDSDTLPADDRAAVLSWSARTCRRGSLRRLVRHARECLVAHWALGNGATWQRSLRDDLARLAKLARVARGESFGTFGDYSDFNSSAARKAFQRLAQRMASGDLLLTEHPAEADRATEAWRASRRVSGLAVVSSVS